MRDCPHCGESIQDEATFCRYCHQEVEPPLWVSSMRKCPYCAEWIDLENDTCKYCGQHVGVVDLEEASAFVDSLLAEIEQESEQQAEQGQAGDSAWEGSASFLESLTTEGEEPEDGGSLTAAGDQPADLEGLMAAADELADLSNSEPDQPAELEHQPPFIRTEPSEFSRDLRQSLIEPEAGEQTEPGFDLPDDVESDQGFGTEQRAFISNDEDAGIGAGEAELAGQAEGQQPLDSATEMYSDAERQQYYGEAAGEDYGYPEAEQTYGDQSAHSDYDQIRLPSEGPAPRSESIYQSEPVYYQDPEELAEREAPEAAEPVEDLRSSVWGAEVSGSQSAGEQQAPAERRKLPAALLQGLVGIVLIGAVGYGIVSLARGPAGAMLAAGLATDEPTETSIPQPTATRVRAPTLPPEQSPSAEPGATQAVATGECLLWDQISLEDEGKQLCAYGVIRRWFAISDVPFVAIFSEEAGTFAIIDRTVAPEVGSGDCIVARGTVEVMSRTRPDIDLNGSLELCPEGWPTGG